MRERERGIGRETECYIDIRQRSDRERNRRSMNVEVKERYI